jgi:hypothetical protein
MNSRLYISQKQRSLLFKLSAYHPGVFTELNKWSLPVKHTFYLYLVHYSGNMFRLVIE